MSEFLYIWLFHGAGSRFSSGVFEDKGLAIDWIKQNGLSGVLTKYPVNHGVYDWAIKENYFLPKNDHEYKSEFIQKFTCENQEHFHFEAGELD